MRGHVLADGVAEQMQIVQMIAVELHAQVFRFRQREIGGPVFEPRPDPLGVGPHPDRADIFIVLLHGHLDRPVEVEIDEGGVLRLIEIDLDIVLVKILPDTAGRAHAHREIVVMMVVAYGLRERKNLHRVFQRPGCCGGGRKDEQRQYRNQGADRT